MITGRWGRPSEVLFDLTLGDDGVVHGIVHPGRQHAPIRRGRFDAATRVLELEGEIVARHGRSTPFLITGRLDGRTLRLAYAFGSMRGETTAVRVEEYVRPRPTMLDELRDRFADLRRRHAARSRPSGEENARLLRARGEPLDSIVLREATSADIPALSALHVELWNQTYDTTHGPSVATRAWQWTQKFSQENRRDFVLVLEDRTGRLIGFTWGLPHDGDFEGQVSKIYLRWEYHGLGLGRRMLREAARRFLERDIRSFMLFAERSNPSIGFYDRMRGERLLDEKGRFTGAYGWRDVRTLLGGDKS